MSKSKRTQVTPVVVLSSWDDADNALLKIGLSQSRIANVEATLNAEVAKLRDAAEKKIGTDKTNVADLELALEAFSSDHRADFGDRQSRVLTHGEVNYRVHPGKIIQQPGTKLDQTLRLIKATGKKAVELYIRIKEELDKEALLQAKPDQLTAFGLLCKNDESFGYAVNWESLSTHSNN